MTAFHPAGVRLCMLAVVALAAAGRSVPQEVEPAPLEPVPSAWKNAVESIQAERLLKDVELLSADELMGRYYRSDEARRTARLIADRFSRAGLEPLRQLSSFEQPVDDAEVSPNVVGCWPGSAAGEYLLVTAHYDHLKPLPAQREGADRIFNGADDNASGVAGLLAIAAALGRLEQAPKASIVLLAFTGEEYGLVGSRYFVRHSPIPLEKIRGVINLDMISRGEEDLLFVEGCAKAPALAEAVRKAVRHVPLELALDRHPEWRRQSDHAAFLDRGVPALYFGVEDHVDYHRVSDHADKILPVLLERTVRLTLLTVLHADT